jgi:hypothetical protein
MKKILEQDDPRRYFTYFISNHGVQVKLKFEDMEGSPSTAVEVAVMVTGCPGTKGVTVVLNVPPAPVVTEVGETVAGPVTVSVK